MLPETFTSLPDLVRGHAHARPDQAAIVAGDQVISWGAADARIDRIAAAFQRDGLGKGAVIAISATMQPDYLLLWLGALRAGLAVAPLATNLPAEALAMMVADSDAVRLWDDAALADLDAWLPPPGSTPARVAIGPDDPFNLIYSSGTTGRPKGIVQPHRQRWAHVQRGLAQGYGPHAVTMVATPLYSNTTLVSVVPTIGLGGTLVLLPKFDTGEFLALSQRHRVSHVMLVPVQYRRLLADPGFDAADLSSYTHKYCTSAPFSPALKAEVLARWPGGLTEYYGMTEGGGTCILHAHAHPDKLHTVGQPAAGSDIRLIDADGVELPPGATGEVVGRSPAMMTGYHKLPDATRAAEWFSPDGQRFIRTGDIGRFDDDGFLTLVDRAKDVIISGGFNIYPSDLEAALMAQPGVIEAAVVGVPSEAWGETPVAFVVAAPGTDGEALRAAANARLGRTQRISELVLVDALPRSEIGKVLKRELRDQHAALAPPAQPA